MALSLVLNFVFGFFAAGFGFSPNEPFIEFKYEAKPGLAVGLATPFYNWNPRAFTLNEIQPGKYYLKLPRPWVEKLPYKFVVNGKWIHDPQNPINEPDGFGGLNSVVPIGFKNDPLLSRTPNTPSVASEKFWFTDLQAKPRLVTASWSPPVFSTQDWFVIYVTDGTDYRTKTGIENLIANLSLDSGLPPIALVFLDPIDRFKEYGNITSENTYLDFLSEVVVVQIESKLGIKVKAKNRAIMGASLGGLFAWAAAIHRPKVFGAVISQSGSFWYRLSEVLKLTQESSKISKAFVDVGLFEDLEGRMLNGNRRLLEIVRQRPNKVTYHEFPTDHDWHSWSNRLQLALRLIVRSD
ncbi:MAG: prolyl oligopeptidase family serine peptidase [Oligoflexia bacterium]|nr:prolyl oligopeptidase family serine peptidase [Oligoflexia bacterium]